jgi:uncharacterized protein YqhQ
LTQLIGGQNAVHGADSLFDLGLTAGNAGHQAAVARGLICKLLGVAIGIALRYLLPTEVISVGWLYTLIRLALLPIVVGLGFEFIMFAGKHDGFIIRMLSAPGMWMQRLTTREPDASMLEVAIVSLKTALPEEFPDFDPSIYERKESTDGETSAEVSESDRKADGEEQADGEEPTEGAE